MAVVGFALSRILIERKESIKTDRIEIKSKLNVKDMKKEPSIKLVEDKEVLKFTFNYEIVYGDELAKIEMGGHLLWMADPKTVKEILKNWEKKKEVPDEFKLGIYNTIFHKCNIKALELEEDFNLPPHIQLPVIQPQEKQTTHAGYTG